MAVFIDLPNEVISLILSFLPHRKDVVTAFVCCRKIFDSFTSYQASTLGPVYATEILVMVASQGRAGVIQHLRFMMWYKYPNIRAILAESAFKALSQDGMTLDLEEVVEGLASLYERMQRQDKEIDILERFCYNIDSISIQSISIRMRLAGLYARRGQLQDAVDLVQHDLVVLCLDVANRSELVWMVPALVTWYMQLGQVDNAADILEWPWNPLWGYVAEFVAEHLAIIYVQRNRREDALAILWRFWPHRECCGYPTSSLPAVEILAQLEEEKGRLETALHILETSFWDTSQHLIHPSVELNIDYYKDEIQRLERHGECLAKLYERVDRTNNAIDLRASFENLHWLKEIMCQNKKNYEKSYGYQKSSKRKETAKRFWKRLVKIF